MSSIALQHWQNDRGARLTEIETHCAAAAVLVPPNALLAEESLRGYAMLLSGHFQGFCRDLYTECMQVFALHAPLPLQATIQAQFTSEMKLNSNNPTVETIRKDFERFDFPLDFVTDPANGVRMTHLGHMNKWRNAVAHQKVGAPIGIPPLTLAGVQSWRMSCNGLAIWLDGILYNEMHRILGAAPW